MQRSPMTFRPLDEETGDDAPPPYEATAAAGAPTATAASVVPSQSYPVLSTTAHHPQHDDGATPLPPPPSFDYYPAMSTASPAQLGSTPAPFYPQYPAMDGTVPHQPSYPVSYAQPQPHQGSQAYPAMLIPTRPGSISPHPTSPYSSSPGRQPPQHPPSAPLVFIEDPAAESLHQPHGQILQDISQDKTMPEHLLTGEDMGMVTEQRKQHLPYQQQESRGRRLAEPNFMDVEESCEATQPASSVTASPTAAPVPEVTLVTNYRCRKCNAILESDTAVCSRIHSLSAWAAEKQVQRATGLDLEERRKRMSHDGNSHRDDPASSSSTAHHGSERQSTYRNNSSGARSQESGESAASPTSLSSALSTHSTPSSSAQCTMPTTSVNTTSTAENNFGTNDTYRRRSFSVQNPVRTLKKFWRDAKKEINYQQYQHSGAQRRSWQHELVAPPPLSPSNGSLTWAGSPASGGEPGRLSSPGYHPPIPQHSSLYPPVEASPPRPSPGYGHPQ